MTWLGGRAAGVLAPMSAAFNRWGCSQPQAQAASSTDFFGEPANMATVGGRQL